MILNSSSEVGRLDISHLGMWLNLDEIPHTEKGRPTDVIASAFRYNFSDSHREAVAAAKSPEERAALVGLLTSVVHEARHFHDLLISRYGHWLMHLNVWAGLGAQGAQGSLAQAPAIIVPLSDWRAQLDTLRLVDADLTEPNPKLSDLANILGTISRLRRALDQGIHNTNAPFTATSILEASAVLIQISAVVRAFGVERANELSRLIGESSNSRRYVASREFVEQQLGPIPIGGKIVLLLAALCGDVFSDDDKALRSPVDVLIALTRWLLSTGKFPIRGVLTGKLDPIALIGELFDLSSKFLARFCGRDLAQSMSFAWEMTSKLITHYEGRLEGKEDDSIQWFRICQIIKVYSNFRDMSARLMANFCADPTSYLVDQYLDRVAYLPQPVMFLWSTRGVPATPELQRDFYIQHEMIVPNPVGADPDLLARLDAISHFDGAAFRSALVLCSLDHQQPAPPDGLFKYALHPVDHESWMGYFDSTVPLVRLLTDGVEARLPGIVLDQAVTALDFSGTKVYSGAGRLHKLSNFPTAEVLRRWDTRYPNWPSLR
jgi:hypothetical protein